VTQETAARRRKTRPADEPLFPNREQRVARGRAARREVPRASHAEYTRAPGRPDPVVLLQQQATVRVPELLPIRYGRMAVSAFTYFRGAALPMASDLADTPRTRLVAQTCGDAHLANFGLFASPERRLVFDINDFDETLPGPWEWDVKRLATSLEIAGRDNGYPARERQEIVISAVAAYRRAIREFADRPTLKVWYAVAEMAALQARLAPQLDKGRRKRIARHVAKAQTKDHLGALDRFVGVHEGQSTIIADPPLITPARDLAGDNADHAEVERGLRDVLSSYRSSLEPDRRVLLDQYRLVDVARKVVGVGSAGTRAYMMLLLGDDLRDPLFLQAKEAGPSVLEEFVGPSEYDNCGQRVVVGSGSCRPSATSFSAGCACRASTGSPATSTCGSCGTGRAPQRSRRWCRKGCASMASCAAGPWPGRTPDLVTASPSRPTSAPVRPSSGPSARSHGPTPTRTRATTGHWWTRSAPAGSPPRPACKPAGGSAHAAAEQAVLVGGEHREPSTAYAELRVDRPHVALHRVH
jgi:uncharacterized protein (DUF2252 family)